MKDKLPFEKILIANRGEIAVRVMKTLKKMAIKSVAVYSEADTNSLHVKMADEAIFIGGSAATDSYLDIDSIISAVRSSGAQAVHPGYGFLSENPNFARALEEEGVALIGPSASAVEMMGDKIQAKKIAIEARVSTVPGYLGEIKNAKEAARKAKKIGFPVMVKAAAGGGGRGMRVVYSDKEMMSAYESAILEATKTFDDSRVFIEKFIEDPRHIEVQLIADKYGNSVCLYERECSIQRYHQKIIEEAPSVIIDDKTRTKMYKQVKALADKVGYYSAGTIEFIVDKNKNFYFLEMNTRLQVEHCVTELITGYDIVEEMINIAAGRKLSFEQQDVKLNGWAIETRICAEDPSRGFLPSSGRIIEYKEPMRTPNIRIDSGVEAGGEVSMFYDAMIAKLCTHAPTRGEAIEHMKKALGDFYIRGISHNMSFLEAIMNHQRFVDGDITTNFIDNEYPDGFLGAELTSEISQIFLSVATTVYMLDAKRATSVSAVHRGPQRQIGTRWIVTIDGQSYPVICKETQGGFNMRQDRKRISVRTKWSLGSKLFKGEVNGEKVSVKIEHTPGGYILTYGGVSVNVTVRSPRVSELESLMPKKEIIDSNPHITAPITGIILNIKVKKGEKVKAGQELLAIEAMKMENTIYAESDCIIEEIYLKPGDNVTIGQVIMDLTQ